MVEEIDVWRAAEQMRKRYGTEAAVQAAMRADALFEKLDLEGSRVWNRIVAAINELERAPKDGEAQH